MSQSDSFDSCFLFSLLQALLIIIERVRLGWLSNWVFPLFFSSRSASNDEELGVQHAIFGGLEAYFKPHARVGSTGS